MLQYMDYAMSILYVYLPMMVNQRYHLMVLMLHGIYQRSVVMSEVRRRYKSYFLP